MRTSLLLVCRAVAVVTRATALCDCGYTVNDTSSQDYAVFTDLFETDFLHVYNISSDTTSPKTDMGWQTQVYNITPNAAHGPYGKNATSHNVVKNPLVNRTEWGGSGIHGGDPGLQIWVRGVETISTINDLKYIQIGEIAADRDDMMYGSFRIGMKVTSTPGTCAAFFWYHNDTQEIDLEYLSAQAPASPSNDTAPLNLVLQSAESAALGYNAALTPGFKLYDLPFRPSDSYHEYRFDWLPSRVDFYADGQYLDSFTADVPIAPGRLIMNHWSTGNPGWSQGPPAVDAVMTISYVKAYFNSSMLNRTEQWDQACAHSWRDRTCTIPDQVAGIDPTGPQGNVTGKTFFFSEEGLEVNQTVYAGATATPGAAVRVSSPMWLGEAAFAMVWMVLCVVGGLFVVR